MHTPSSKPRRQFAVALFAATLSALPAPAATYSFTNAGGNNQYANASNWSGGVVPNTSNGDVALINNGSPVTYTPGSDLTFANGGSLHINSGSFTQVQGSNYIQLKGGGSIVVNGGSFNQGTASSLPFNVTGTGNAFTVSAGSATINSSFQIDVGLMFTQSGGTINVTGNETNFNGGGTLLSGGTLNTKLITGVNGSANSTFNISGGTLNLTGAAFNGVYGGGTAQYINFTSNSTGIITFSSGATTISDVQNFINAGVIEYNGGGMGTLSSFDISSNAGIVTLQLASAVPEPATSLAGCLLTICVAPVVARRLRRRSV